MVFRRTHLFPPWLLATNLSTLGHTRRLRHVTRNADDSLLFEYVFETGFEHRRFRHHWVGAVQMVRHGFARALVAGSGWARAVGAPIGHRRINFGPPASPSILTAHLEDPEQWSGPESADVRAWFANQSPDHVWEIVPDHVIGYVPGVLTDQIGESMMASTRSLAELLLSHPPRGTVSNCDRSEPLIVKSPQSLA